VILDVVFNHTAEGNEKGPTLSFRGLDNRVYYMLAPLGEYYNYRCAGVWMFGYWGIGVCPVDFVRDSVG
jgi:pullulanase/glycogen debranching enzyme